jgi:iron-sulfur cluster assembly accessory protein
MITLTPGAISKVKSILADREEDLSLRIAIVGSGCSGFQYRMTLEKEPKEEDHVIELDGVKIFVDTKSMVYLKGTQVDYVDAHDGAGFTFDNPNTQAACGCGDNGCFEA